MQDLTNCRSCGSLLNNYIQYVLELLIAQPTFYDRNNPRDLHELLKSLQLNEDSVSR